MRRMAKIETPPAILLSFKVMIPAFSMPKWILPCPKDHPMN